MPIETHQFGYDRLFAGGVSPVVATPAILKSGAGVIARGTVLGRIGTNANGMPELKIVNSANTDGSEDPFAVLADVTVDATSADQRISVYLTGEFNRDALVFGGTDTVEDHEQAMRNAGMFIKTVV